MNLLSMHQVEINHEKLNIIENMMKSIYRLIIYSRHHSDDDLLDAYLNGISSLKELIGIKNAQMEAQSEEEVEGYYSPCSALLSIYC